MPEHLVLIGQYDSPFVRRVAITLRLYGFEYEHRPWSVWSNSEEIARHNPLRRVPTLLLADGTALVESSAILDTLDDLVGPERALLPRSGAVRREGLRLSGLATGLGDKAVSLFYELLRKAPSEVWVERCKKQILDTLDLLEAERARKSSSYLLGDAMTHADVATTCALRFTSEAHADFVDQSRWPSLAAYAARCEALEVFRSISQPVTVTISRGSAL